MRQQSRRDISHLSHLSLSLELNVIYVTGSCECYSLRVAFRALSPPSHQREVPCLPGFRFTEQVEHSLLLRLEHLVRVALRDPCRPNGNGTVIKSHAGRSFIYSLADPCAGLMDFTGGSRIHDLFSLRGSPWELCSLQVQLVKSNVTVLHLKQRNMSSFLTS